MSNHFHLIVETPKLAEPVERGYHSISQAIGGNSDVKNWRPSKEEKLWLLNLPEAAFAVGFATNVLPIRCLWVIATAAIARRQAAVRMNLTSDCRPQR
jgi:hypothetical protein